MLNFVICDDEIHMLNRLEQLFKKCFLMHDYDAKIVLKTTDYKNIFSYMSSNKVDVVVLVEQNFGITLTGPDFIGIATFKDFYELLHRKING